MKCSQCGAELFDGAAFCGECGARADGTAAEVSARTDSKPRTRATVNPQRRQRQTAPRISSDRSVAESLSGAAGLKVYDEAKKNGPVDLQLNEDGTMAAETGRSPRKQRADAKRAQRESDEALRMESEQSSVERTSGQAKDAPAETNQAADITFKSTSASSRSAGESIAVPAAAATAATAAATAAEVAEPAATPADADVPAAAAAATPATAPGQPAAASFKEGATQPTPPINVAAADWDDALTTIIDPVQSAAPAASNQPTAGEAYFDQAEAPTAASMRPVVERPDRVAGIYEAQHKKKRRRAIAAAVLAVALLAGAGGAWFMQRQAESEAETQAIVQENEAKSQQAKEQAAAAQQQEAEVDLSATPHNVRMSVSGVNFDENATRIPVQLMGTTQAGDSINQVAFVGSDGRGITVPAGTYSATVLASPIASNGMLYTVSNEPIDFTITQDMAEEVSTGQAIILMPIEAANITEDMVNYSYSLAVQDTGGENRAAACKEAADKVLAENKQKTDAESARLEKERLRQARPQLAQEFVSNYFTNVMFTNSNDDSEILLIENWTDVVLPYVKEGTGLANSLLGEKSGSYYAARNVIVSSQDDNSVTLNVDVASSDQIVPGWTANNWNAVVKCTFDDNNDITAMEVTTSSGTTKY